MIPSAAMAKAKTQYVCTECGASSPKWAGQCGDCGAWNSLTEFRPAQASPGARSGGYAGQTTEVVELAAVKAEEADRTPTGIGELDRVLGGGIVPGSVILLGGDPGIGKSTLLLQVSASVMPAMKSLYITGEESLQQVALRAGRLGLDQTGMHVGSETSVENIIATASKHKPDLMIVDSIQTMYSEGLQSAPGSVGQVREAAAQLVRWAKQSQTAVFLVGHVTKEGGIAGPRVLEHMVDAVLYFEGDSASRYRIIRALKNRFGAANELGVFAMTETGLKAVSNPSAIFLSGGNHEAPGSVVMVAREGTRAMLLEVQALVAQSQLANPRRVAVGLEQNRLAMLLAVLQRRAGLTMFDQDVFINVVGGVRITETASDLPVLLAVMSSLRDQAMPAGTAAFGEVGLGGEVRPVFNGEERFREAQSQGFRRLIVPKANQSKAVGQGVEVHAIANIADLNDVF